MVAMTMQKIRGLTPPARRVFAIEIALVLAAGQAFAADEWPELDPKSPRRTFLDAAFDDADSEPRGISQVQLAHWLSPSQGPNFRLMETNRGQGSVAGFEGTARLRAPWPDDAVLALTPFDHHGLAIYLWNGHDGVSLHYYQHPRPNWAAYRTTRKESEPQPATFALVSTDNEAYSRSLAGALEIRHQSGNIIVNRGNVQLLWAPFASPPSEVYFDKRGWFRSFAMYRADPMPEELRRGEVAGGEPAAPNLSVLGKTSPAVLDWTIQPAAGSRLAKTQNGGIELVSEPTAATTWAGLKISRSGLYEIILRLGESSPATGVYLGDDLGKPLYVLGIVRDQRARQPVLQFLRPDAGGFEIGADLNQLQVPFIGPSQWLRLIAGSGTIKCWTSGDGAHWSRVLDPWRGVAGSWAHVGLVSFKWNEPRRITLEHLQISDLTAVTELADEKLLLLVPPAVMAGDSNPAAWQTRVRESLPAGIDLASWRRACAIRTVAALPSSPLGNAALNGLAEDIIMRQAPPARRMRALDGIAELYDGWEPPDSFRLSQFYERLGKRLVQEGNRQPWTEVGRFLPTAPIWTYAQFQTVPESLANAELLFRIYSEDWNSVGQLCRELKLLNRPGPPEQGWPDNRQRVKLLVDWALASAESAQSERAGQERAGVDRNGAGPQRRATTTVTLPFHWQHPLLADLSKEGFNTLAELEATLDEKSYREACQIISSARPEQTTGLLPDGRDGRLLLSLPQAVDTAMHDDPILKQTMNEQFGAIGGLRLKQALADGNARQVQALTVQFCGTPAAAAAHEWLGDRALVTGNFAWASAEFEHALSSADREQRSKIAARWRLAAALLGRDAGEPPTEPVVFESSRLEPEAFERLVAEMKHRAVAKGSASPAVAESAPRAGVKAVRYEVQQRASLRGDVGDQPGNPVSGEVDWVARQIGYTVSGNVLCATNRFQVSAFNLKTSQQLWSQPLGKEQGPAHGWGLCPSRPFVAGESLLVRRLARTNPEMACFNVANGAVRWTTRPSTAVISDPLVLQDRLFIFTAAMPHENGLISIDFSLVDQASGEIVTQQSVIQLRNLWDRQLSCQAALAGTRIVAICGGTVFCCDLAGNPLWVRRQLWIPSAQAPVAYEQSPHVPLAIGNRLFATQPGVFAVECLDLETGRRVWQKPIPDLRRLIGLAGPRLVVETARGWQARAPDSGKLLWQQEADQILDAQICPASGDLLVAQRERQPNDQWRAVLIWLDAQTGRETARQPLAPFVDPQPMLGPLVVHEDRLWTFFGRGVRNPYRDLFELIPTADPAQAPRATASLP
jgi:outer membrane protein assembly factor BamB